MKDFKPMLAAAIEDVNLLKFPLLASPKLDGIRAVVIDGVVMSRNLKPIPNKHVQKLFGKQKFNGLDGELIAGEPTAPDCFRQTSSAVMSVEGKSDVKFYVFDLISECEKGFTDRLKAVHLMAGQENVPIVPYIIAADIKGLEKIEDYYLDKGYEGVMLRKADAPYKFGRGTLKAQDLMKLKRFLDGEAEVIGIEEQMENTNEAKKDALGRTERSSHKAGKRGKGTLGAFIVRDLVTGIQFNIGTGMDDILRLHLWGLGLKNLKGKLVKYRYFPSGSKEKPRFPVYLGFRDPIDL